MSMRESACKLAFAMVCIIRSALLPAQFPTGLVAVWASPTGYIVRMAQGTNSLKLLLLLLLLLLPLLLLLLLCLLYTSPSPRDVEEPRMPSSA